MQNMLPRTFPQANSGQDGNQGSTLPFKGIGQWEKRWVESGSISNGNDIKTKAERSFDLVFAKAKWICLFQNL